MFGILIKERKSNNMSNNHLSYYLVQKEIYEEILYSEKFTESEVAEIYNLSELEVYKKVREVGKPGFKLVRKRIFTHAELTRLMGIIFGEEIHCDSESRCRLCRSLILGKSDPVPQNCPLKDATSSTQYPYRR